MTGPRTLRVLVGTLPIEDGQTPPPVVGEVGHFRLLFVEAEHDGPDATVVTVQARAEPAGDGSPSRGGLMWDGTVRDDPPHWSTMLHGNGWTASWQAPRPVVGQVVLRGTVVGDLNGGQVRGRVTRARVVSETFDLTDPDHPRIPALQRLREVDTGPRRFDHGLVAPPDAPSTGWFSPVPGDPYVVETGVLVDLDLDDVPPLPLRPTIVPGALSVHARDVWVADTRLPCAIRLRDGGIVRFAWPGRILSAEESRGRRVHADAGGCWITGPDGVHRCDGVGVRTVLEGHVWPAAAAGGVLAVQVDLDPGDPHARQALRIVRPSGAIVDVASPDRAASSLASDGDGFLMLVTPRWHAGVVDHDGRPRVARLSPTGEYREGRPLPGSAHDYGEVLGSGLVGGRQGLFRVRPDLGLDAGPPPPRRLLGAWMSGPRMVVVTHVSDEPGRRPFVEPTGPRPDGPCWLLAELDPADLTPLRSAYVPAIPTTVSADGEWLLAAGVRHWPRDGPGGPEPVDIAALIDRAG